MGSFVGGKPSWSIKCDVSLYPSLQDLFLGALVKPRLEKGKDFNRFLKPDLIKSFSCLQHLPSLQNAFNLFQRLYDNSTQRPLKVLVYGDYDVDGLNSSYLLYRALQNIKNVEVKWFVPDRLNDGYGPHNTYIKQLFETTSYDLVIFTDCGTSALVVLKQVYQLNAASLVFDHHQSKTFDQDALPHNCVMVNPHVTLCLNDDLKNLCATGLTFLFLQILKERWPDCIDFNEAVFCAGLGTLCDIMPLKGFNRALVAHALTVFPMIKSYGLKALLQIGCHNKYHVDKKALLPASAELFGFKMGPLINAAGRLGQTFKAKALFEAKTYKEAEELVYDLKALNEKRKEIEQTIYLQAYQQALEQHHSPILVLKDKRWHKGVIGIVAARIKERFNKPTLMAALEQGMDDQWAGSGRSTEDVHLAELMYQAVKENVINKGGGHAKACGFSLTTEQFPAFQNVCQTFCKDIDFAQPKLEIDAVLTLDQVRGLWEPLQQLQPFGEGNPSPLFLFENVGFDTINCKSHQVTTCRLVTPGKAIAAVSFSSSKEQNIKEIILKSKKAHVVGKIGYSYWDGIQIEIVDAVASDDDPRAL